MRITVVFLGRANEIAGRSITILELPDNSSLLDLMKKLGDEVNPKLFSRYIEGHFVFIIYVNGVPTIDLKTQLRDGDRVTLITPEMGG